MHHGQGLLTRLLSIRSRKAYYEQLERVNRESDEDRKIQTRRGNMEGARLDSTINRVPRHNGKT